jgi:hypothetical protein
MGASLPYEPTHYFARLSKPFAEATVKRNWPKSLRLERVMNLGENRIEMRISRSAWFPRDLCFPHS